MTRQKMTIPQLIIAGPTIIKPDKSKTVVVLVTWEIPVRSKVGQVFTVPDTVTSCPEAWLMIASSKADCKDNKAIGSGTVVVPEG